ncbi:MAG: bile acid:sodium symporter family protein, partial [Calditrichaeota bacterium]|nr:bile acid:sodium symporter family protein [Calditrichota bacterium]
MPIDEIALNFSPAGLLVMNIVLGIVMFGIALDMKLGDFKLIVNLPRSMLIGLLGQFLLLPALTFMLVYLLRPAPSMALGMILVAACPGGNISNFFTHLARGNTALSVCMSAVSTASAVVMTPLNFTFWGSLYPDATLILRTVAVNAGDLAATIFLLLGLPLSTGLYISHRYPRWAARVKRPMRYFSMGFFVLFVLSALAVNFEYFINYVHIVALIVLVHNGLALLGGYFSARMVGLPENDRRAVAIEVGIQNSGLGLILIFNFFDGLGGMAIIAAWWGIWHIISGMFLASFWA